MIDETKRGAAEALRKKLSLPTNKGGAQAEVEYADWYRLNGGQRLKRKYTAGR